VKIARGNVESSAPAVGVAAVACCRRSRAKHDKKERPTGSSFFVDVFAG